MLIPFNNPAVLEARITANANDVSTQTAQIRSAPYWVRLTRAGNVFTGSVSPDGATWTTVGTYTVAMAAQLRVGLAVTSHLNTNLNTAVFDNVSITGGSVQVVVAPTLVTLTTGTTQQFTAHRQQRIQHSRDLAGEWCEWRIGHDRDSQCNRPLHRAFFTDNVANGVHHSRSFGTEHGSIGHRPSERCDPKRVHS